MPGSSGVGAVLSGLLHQVMAQSDHLSPADLDRLSGTVVDLLTAVLAREVETDPSSFVTDPGALLVLRVRLFRRTYGITPARYRRLRDSSGTSPP